MAIMDKNNPETYGMNLPTAMVIASFTTIAWVNTIELQIRIAIGFKRYTGLYFWSLLASSWGCAIHPLGFVMLDFDIWTNPHVAGVVIGIGWWMMVTGQALVLYSRLYLVVRDKRKIRWVLIMIITNFWILHIPIMIVSQVVSFWRLLFPCYISCDPIAESSIQAYSNIPTAGKWLQVYNVYEKVQMTGFSIQEIIISGLYLWETRKILAPGRIFQQKKTRAVFHHLIYVNVFIIFLDAALLSTEYANLFSIQTVFKAAVYSIKLRFEFIVLNQLMDIVQGRASAFDLSANAASGTSGAYGTQRSAQKLQLDTLNARNKGDRDGNSYSVFATKGIGAPNAAPNPDGVLRTTEVLVHHASPTTLEEGDRQYGLPTDDYAGAGHGDAIMKADARATSPASSAEVEFAGKGA